MRWLVPALATVAAVSLQTTLPMPMSAAAQPGASAGPAPATGFHAGAAEQSYRSPERHAFAFTRAAYRGAGWRGGGSWSTDYPKADRQFLVVLRRVTNLDAYPLENALRLDDPELRRYPFLYAVEVGRMALSDEEVEGLRSYLDAGGFLVVDDFWGTREWQVFEYNMSRVFPDRPIVDVPMDHPLFRVYYQIDELVQVPSINNVLRGRTWERDGYEPHVRGIFDERGRLVVAVNWNTDLGDAWEWADIPEYPLEYSTYAYEMGVNLIVYAMSR